MPSRVISGATWSAARGGVWLLLLLFAYPPAHAVVVPKVGTQLQIYDARAFSVSRTLRERFATLIRPTSEAAFAWASVHHTATIEFAEESACGNGVITVTSSGPRWRCMMFDDVEQGIAFMDEDGRSTPSVLGFEYLRVMAAAGMAFQSLSLSNRMLCIGLGTGALPGFLAHHFPHLAVDVVELDPAVLRAAQESLGCDFELIDGAQRTSAADDEQPASSAPYRVWLGDAAEYLLACSTSSSSSAAAAATSTVDKSGLGAIFLDAFNNEGETPNHLLSDSFLRDCQDALAPGGVLVCNCFNGPEGSARRVELARRAAAFAASVGPVYTFSVPTQEESVVLCACKASDGGARSSSLDTSPRAARRELIDAARSAWASSASRPGRLRRREATRLTRRVLWARVAAEEEATLLQEVVPPEGAADVDVGWDELRPGSSACAAWMQLDNDDEEEEARDEETR